MKVIQSPSTHFYKTRMAKIDTIVIHYISAINLDPKNPFDVERILNLLKRPIPYSSKDEKKIQVLSTKLLREPTYKEMKKKGIKAARYSAHYLIDRGGAVYQLVDESNVAWHAGKSSLDGRKVRNSCNDFSIGIELVGGKWCDFTDAQYYTLFELTQNIQSRYSVPKKNIVGHEFIAPGRKVDPGKTFEWPRYLNSVFKEKKSEPKNLISEEKKLKEKSRMEKVIKELPENDITDGSSKMGIGMAIYQFIMDIISKFRR